MPPLHDEPSATRSPLDAFTDCASIAIGEVEPKHQRAIRAALERLQREATREDRSIQRVLAAVDDARAAFDACATSDRTALAERLDDAASCDEQFVSDAGWAWILEGRSRIDRSETTARAVQALVRGTTLLSRSDDSVDRNRYTVGLRYHARAIVESDVDSALDLLTIIVELSQRTGDKNIRNRALGCTSDLADAIQEQRPQDALAICDRALALDRGQPSRQTWLGLIDCTNARAIVLRKLGRTEDALVACEQSVQLADEHALGDDAAGSVAWALCEGAYIAAELTAQPDRALRLIASLRARSGPVTPDTDDEVVAELAYAISMEARSWLAKDQPVEALTACDEAIALAERVDDSGARGAHAAALRLRGDALIALRRPQEARDAWTRAVERFIDDAAPAVRDEAIRARAMLSLHETHETR